MNRFHSSPSWRCHQGSRRLPILLVLACSLLAGCGSPAHNALVGNWKIDQPAALGARVNAQLEEADGGQPRMRLVFFWNGKLETQTQLGALASRKSGSWEVIQASPDGTTVTLSCQLQGQTTEHEVTFVDPDTIRLVPPNMAGVPQPLTFRRE